MANHLRGCPNRNRWLRRIELRFLGGKAAPLRQGNPDHRVANKHSESGVWGNPVSVDDAQRIRL